MRPGPALLLTVLVALAGLVLAGAARRPATSAAVRPASAATTSPAARACDLALNVVDPDPRGPNVRSTPGGTVVARLVPSGEWIQLRVRANAGDWFRIDRAVAIDDNARGGEREVWRGDGWVHRSTVGVSELLVGEGTILRDAPTPGGKVLKRIAQFEDEPRRVQVTGCSGRYLQVDADGVKGWTDTFCTNERTGCS